MANLTAALTEGTNLWPRGVCLVWQEREREEGIREEERRDMKGSRERTGIGIRERRKGIEDR